MCWAPVFHLCMVWSNLFMNPLQLSDYWLHFAARGLCHIQHPKSWSFLILSSCVHGRVCRWGFYLPGSLQHYPNKLTRSALGIWGSLHLHSGGFASDGDGFPALYSETTCVFPKVRNHTSVTSRIVREGFLALTSSKDTKGDTQVCGLTSHCQQPLS